MFVSVTMKKPIFIGKQIDEAYYGVYRELTPQDYNHIKALHEKSVEATDFSETDLLFLSEIKDDMATNWIKLFLKSESQIELRGLLTQIGEILESFTRFEKNFPYFEFIVKLVLTLEQYRKDKEQSLLYESDEEMDWLAPSIEDGALEFIEIDFVDVIREWEDVEGPRMYVEASCAEDDEYAMEEELSWLIDKSNMGYLEEYTDSIFTIPLLRVIRNNAIKSLRTKQSILSSTSWMELVEII